MSFSNYLELEILDQIFGGLDYAEPATLYIALSTADPTEDGSGLAEPAGGSYARKGETNDKTTWSVAAAGALSNAIAITFVQATGDWGTITHFAVMDSLAGGNMLGYGALGTAKDIDNGDTARFAIGELDVTLT
jgi:hypothetical protein